ncbi:hypothetical protein VF11_35855, partial [Nostoc linckia z14]
MRETGGEGEREKGKRLKVKGKRNQFNLSPLPFPPYPFPLTLSPFPFPPSPFPSPCVLFPLKLFLNFPASPDIGHDSHPELAPKFLMLANKEIWLDYNAPFPDKFR